LKNRRCAVPNSRSFYSFIQQRRQIGKSIKQCTVQVVDRGPQVRRQVSHFQEFSLGFCHPTIEVGLLDQLAGFDLGGHEIEIMCYRFSLTPLFGEVLFVAFGTAAIRFASRCGRA
jgi:hypothetical protein